ncbi:unnamed protein product [Porites evermanni]|uniref:VPS10 domain-containing protein n=1 Tax=Porites evermanni TaxID=104178 RepID=A0ABN8LKV1_9CNID|nr:unnamed protein product [Porites evermanni]
MRLCNSGIIFLILACCTVVLSVELTRNKPAKDLLKLSMPSKARINAKRFRRDADPTEPPDVLSFGMDKEKCEDPTISEDREITNFDWKFENETKLSISMAWIGKRKTGEASALLLLATTEFSFLFTKPSVLYRSDDFGKKFRPINAEIFNTHIRKAGGIMKSPVNPKKVILVSHGSILFLRNSVIVRTIDGGETWTNYQLPFQVTGPLLFHPREEDWILGRGVVNGKVFLSKDFGKTWTFLQTYVRDVKWGARTDKKDDKEEKTILMTVAASPQGFLMGEADLMRSRDLGEKFESIHVQHVFSFGLQGPFLYVSINHNKNNNTRIMHVSKDGGDSWNPVQVPTITPERFYSILDMSEGMIFLHVDDPGDTGKGVLYTSDADGIVFSESLRDHVYTNYGEVNDFFKVESMKGTYLTSRMNSDNSVTSLISYDRGGEWKLIPLTEKQCEGVSLKPNERCSLQIHNRFSASRGVVFPQGPLSLPNAVGVIIAHGNPGVALTRRADVWMTRDGGYNWYKVLDGIHHYSIGDHGNLIVAVPAYGTSTKFLMYSVNEGLCWFKYRFTEHDFHVTGLVTEPGAKTMRFSIWGYTLPSPEWEVITVDFEKVLTRHCGNDDYEDWVAHEGGKNNGCLLGKKVTFKRLKKQSLCFNGLNYEPNQQEECCKCTQDDMECDYGYRRLQGSTECKKIKENEPELCLNGDVENLKDSLGYRLIPGDSCCGGDKHVRRYLDTHQLCKNDSWYDYGMDYNYEAKNGKHSKTVLFVVIPMLFIIIIAAIYFGRKYWKLRKMKPDYRYSTLSQEDEDESEGADGLKYNPRPRGLRAYKDVDTDDDDATMIDL